MKFQVNIVTNDEAGNVASRKLVGEYATELEAIMAVGKEDNQMRRSGTKNSHVEMVQIAEKRGEHRIDG